MSYLKRKQSTKPIPSHAVLVTVKGVPSAQFKNAAGKTITAPLTKNGQRVRIVSKKWYGCYSDVNGQLQEVPLFIDKTASQQKLAEIVRKVERGQTDLADPFAEHHARPLADHVQEWHSAMRHNGAGETHATKAMRCVQRIVESCAFSLMRDISASNVQQFLAELRRDRAPAVLEAGKEWYTKKELAEILGSTPGAVTPMVKRHKLEAVGNGKARRYARSAAEFLLTVHVQGASIKTTNLYLDAMKGFCRWLVKDKRLEANPVDHLAGGNVNLDRRHDRRILDEAELQRVIQAARQSSKVFRDMAGEDRAMLYTIACVTGFRAEELSTLCPQNFRLGENFAEAFLSAANTKNGKEAIQPLPLDMAAAIETFLAGKPADRRIWPGTWFQRAAEMLRIDLEAAGIPYAVESHDGPLYADFHALRHSFVALLDRSGATLKEAMQLARHSDPKLTMRVYGRARLHDLAGAVEKLPSLLPMPKEPAEKHAG